MLRMVEGLGAALAIVRRSSDALQFTPVRFCLLHRGSRSVADQRAMWAVQQMLH